ncbi:hypothetical protein C8J57DRAFT_1459663 [Mycena rebaudengoi]|nr:hypothetical protein C8J57DRAFT_1459663 [Mycena rebaudengoi]
MKQQFFRVQNSQPYWWELPCEILLPRAVGGGLGAPIGGLNIGWELPPQGSNCHAAQRSEGGPQQQSNCPALSPTTNLTVLQRSDPTMLPSWDPTTIQKGSNQRRTLRPHAPTITLHALNTRAAQGTKYSFFWQKRPQTPQVEVGAPISRHLCWELPAKFFGSACSGWELPPVGAVGAPTHLYLYWETPTQVGFPYSMCPTGHRTLEIPDHIDEELFLRAVNGEKIVEEEDQQDECCKVYSSCEGKKGKNVCPFNHIKEGRAFEANVNHLPCDVELFVFIPHEDKHPELARMCVVVPDPKHTHRHPIPPLLKVTHAVAEKYKECVRKLGLGATVAKVEKAVETYIAEQKGHSDEDQYIYVSEREGRTAIFGIKHEIIKYIHKVRTLDCDTTFKPVVGKTNLYEINGDDTGSVWMKLHDRWSFQFVWEELLSLVRCLTGLKLGFVSLHHGRTLLGINADMEAAPLLGLADALLPTIDIPSVAEEVKAHSQMRDFRRPDNVT